MKDEIKEILEDMDLVVNKNKVPIYYSQNDIKIVLDYITNLQEKYNEYKNLYFSEHKVKEDYKSRCKRAIQREMELSYLCDTQPDEELLNILQGEDNENN